MPAAAAAAAQKILVLPFNNPYDHREPSVIETARPRTAIRGDAARQGAGRARQCPPSSTLSQWHAGSDDSVVHAGSHV